jgi:hypothetical protein
MKNSFLGFLLVYHCSLLSWGQDQAKGSQEPCGLGEPCAPALVFLAHSTLSGKSTSQLLSFIASEEPPSSTCPVTNMYKSPDG